MNLPIMKVLLHEDPKHIYGDAKTYTYTCTLMHKCIKICILDTHASKSSGAIYIKPHCV